MKSGVRRSIFPRWGIPFTVLRTKRGLELPDSTIVLTFDDGPNNHQKITEQLIDVLRKHHVSAHFCLIGCNAERFPELVVKIFQEGHDIVCHGFSDAPVIFKSKASIRQDIIRFLNALRGILGNAAVGRIRFYRPSFGIYGFGMNSLLQEFRLSLLPITFYAWDADFGPNSKNEIVNNTVDCIRKSNGGVLVFHDGRDAYGTLEKEVARCPEGGYNRGWIPEAVDSIITQLKSDGFSFKLLQECKQA